MADLKPGQRVAYGTGPIGAYSDVRLMPADRLVPLPEGVPAGRAVLAAIAAAIGGG